VEKPLPKSFYSRDTKEVANGLLGKILVREFRQGRVGGKIVETEAYYGDKDPASHAFRGKTKRARIMWGPPGIAYVYLIYGMYYLLNVVTEKEGKPGAVLIRALHPLEGIELMKKMKKANDTKNLTNGPAKLTQVFNVTLKEHGCDLTSGSLRIEDGKKEKFEIVSRGRIGVSAGSEAKLRFYIKGDEFVSVK